VMAVIDFDMHFTDASIGQPDSMHDTNVLYHALEADEELFPHPPTGTLQSYIAFSFILNFSWLINSTVMAYYRKILCC
jgi:hypothetical protein